MLLLWKTRYEDAGESWGIGILMLKRYLHISLSGFGPGGSRLTAQISTVPGEATAEIAPVCLRRL